MGSVLVGRIVLGVAGLAVRSMIRTKKSGKSPVCGGDCSQCGGRCH